MISYLLLPAVILDGVILAAVQNVICKQHIKNTTDNFLYLGIMFLLSAFTLVFAGGLSSCSAFILGLSFVTGVFMVLEEVFSMKALQYGPMSLTVMVGMSSMVVPLFPAALLWQQPIGPKQVAGVLMILCSMALVLELFDHKKKEKPENSANADSPVSTEDEGKPGREMSYGITPRWIGFVIIVFFAGGTIGICETAQAVSVYSDETIPFLSRAFVTAGLLCSGLMVYNTKVRGEAVTMRPDRKLGLGFAATGIMMALLYVFMISAVKVLPAAVVYPVTNGGRLLMVTVVDVVKFHQKLSRHQIIGLLIGVSAIIVLSV